MVAKPGQAERLLAQQIAEEYRQQGYEVSTELPLDFFHNYRADLVVRKDDDTRVIEVKSRASLAADQRIVELAQLIDSKPGWSFELTLVGEPENLTAPSESRPFGIAEVQQRLGEAVQLWDTGHVDSAFTLVWSTFEAAVRMLLAAEGVTDDRITSSSYVLDQARYLGLLAPEDYSRLTEALAHRNAIVHGFSHSGLSDDAVRLLIQTVRQMIDSAELKDLTRI